MKNLLSLIILSFIMLGCSDKPERVPKSKMWHMARDIDPNVAVIIPKDQLSGVKCSDYGEGCIGAFKIAAKTIDLILIEFPSEKHARLEALRLDQFYYKNWVFDDVAGEPVLESFIKRVYDARRPALELKKAEATPEK